MKSIIKIAIFALVITSLSIATVSAQQGSNNTKDRVPTTEQKDTAKENATEQRSVYKCESAILKADAILSRYQRNHENHQYIYQNMVSRITEVLDQIDKSGYDTTEARTQLDLFQIQIQNTNQEMEQLGVAIQNAKTNICNEDSDGTRNSLEQAREQLRNIKKEMLQLRSFYQENVKPELIKLRQQMATDTDTADIVQ